MQWETQKIIQKINKQNIYADIYDLRKIKEKF